MESAEAAHLIFEVDIRDIGQYQELMKKTNSTVEGASGKYLARGGAHKVDRGAWQPRRIVLLEFPSATPFESYYNGSVYRGFMPILDASSSARLVSMESLP